MEIKRVERLVDTAPNIKAVVNFPENSVPARGYIFEIEFERNYGTIERSAEHFKKRVEKTYEKNAQFILGFIKGNSKRDIVFWPFVFSSDGILLKSKPYMVQSSLDRDLGEGIMSGETPNLYDDKLIITGYERLLARQISREKYINNFPIFPKEYGLEYID